MHKTECCSSFDQQIWRLNYSIIHIYIYIYIDMGPLTQATGPPRSGAGVGVGILRGPMCFTDTPGGPYVLDWHSRGGPMCFIDTPVGPYVLYWQSQGALCAFLTLPCLKISEQISISCFLIDMKFISMIFEILFHQVSLFPVPIFTKLDKRMYPKFQTNKY